MSILPPNTRSAPPPSVVLSQQICAAPNCAATPLDGLRVPLCADCARQVAFQYIADFHISNHGEPGRSGERELRVPQSHDRERVYFVRLGSMVKIGYSANITGRLEAIPHEEVLAVFPGTMRDERTCHRKFAHLRTVGEWFQDDPSIREFIAAMAATNAA